jgi:hypothetical protein
MAKVGLRRILFLSIVFVILISGTNILEACYRYPAYHYPKPSYLYRREVGPDSYPYSPHRRFTSNLTTNFRLDRDKMELVPFTPAIYDEKPFMYIGPNKIGSYQLLTGPGIRLTPGHNLNLSWDIDNYLTAWHYNDWYDWSLINYWYSRVHRGHWESRSYCYSWITGSGEDATTHTRCYSYNVYVVDCYNYYEVYYWTPNIYRYRTTGRKTWQYPVYDYHWPNDPPKENTRISTGSQGSNTNHYQIGLRDFRWSKTVILEQMQKYFYGWYINLPRLTLSQSQYAYVHPRMPTYATWNAHATNVWHPSLEDTKVTLRFNWGRHSLNRSEEKYYIEYDKIFDGWIHMKDIVKMLSNLGFGQVDVPVYMALEDPNEPKLYLVTTPAIVNGQRVVPAGFNVPLHPATVLTARGFIREARTNSRGEPIFSSSGKPLAGDLKYIFTKIFDVNHDDKVDNQDKQFFDAAFPEADVNEDGKIDNSDTTWVGRFAFNGFPAGFEDLGNKIRAEFARNPRLRTDVEINATNTRLLYSVANSYYSVVGPAYVVEPDGKASITLYWIGNAYKGWFYLWGNSNFSSKYYARPFHSIAYDYTTDPGVCGPDFLTNLGPRPTPSLAELFKKTTMNYPDGTLIGRLKTKYVEVFPRGCFYNKVYNTSACLHAIGDPWGLGRLESINSGVMGELFIRGDADGNGYFDKNDMKRWSEVQARDGFLLSTVYRTGFGYAALNAVATDLDRKFKVTTGAKFATYATGSSHTIKESYNYKYLNPTLWAYDPAGNQFSYGRKFTRSGGNYDPGDPPTPPYPPTETKYVPTTITGPDSVPEDIPNTWRAPGSKMVIIKPGTWEQTWSISPAVSGGTGSGSSFTYEFLQAGIYTIIHTVKYTERIVSPVTDYAGIIIYYAVNDIPRTEVLTHRVKVYDHDPADFVDPILTYEGPGDTATYAPQWGAESAALRKRDFPTSFKAYSNTRAYDLSNVIPLPNNDWKEISSTGTGNTYIDNNFDLVNAGPATNYDFDLGLQIKFSRKVNEVSDLNSANALNRDHLEAYSGVLLDAGVNIKINVYRELVNGSRSKVREFDYAPSLVSEGSSNINETQMSTYLVNIGGRYQEIEVANFASEFSYGFPEPTFPDQNYETEIVLSCTKRTFSVNSSDGKISYVDTPMTYTWKRKSFSVDVTPPSLFIEEFDGVSGFRTAASNVIHANSGDETLYKFRMTDNHPGHGPNDGLKNGGTRRYWYPRFWMQQINMGTKQFTTIKGGYQLPMMLPTVANKLLSAPDGDIDGDIANFNIERVDGHKIALHKPATADDLGTKGNQEMTIRHRISPYMAGKIKYIIEVEDGSRNYTRKEGYFKVVDNKRPNLDLRLASAKYRPVPDDGTLDDLDDIKDDTPLGPTSQPFGRLDWASDAVKDRVKGSKTGLLSSWCHPYRTSDQRFVGDSLSSNFEAAGYSYDRYLSLDNAANKDVTENNASKYDDLRIELSDNDIKAKFNVANPDAPGFAEDEVIVFDLSVRDNILFRQDDTYAPNGKVVADQNFSKIYYKFVEDTIDEYEVPYNNEFEDTPVGSRNDVAPLRLLNQDNNTPLSYIFRVGNADVDTGLKNNSGKSSGKNTFYLEVTDLEGNSRELFLDFPIIPSKYQIRVLESDTEAERSNIK